MTLNPLDLIHARSLAGTSQHTRADNQALVAAIRAVENLAAHWETLAPGDQYYARMIRSAIKDELS